MSHDAKLTASRTEESRVRWPKLLPSGSLQKRRDRALAYLSFDLYCRAPILSTSPS